MSIKEVIFYKYLIFNDLATVFLTFNLCKLVLMKLSIVIITLTLLSCGKDDPNPSGYEYPKGITVMDKTSINDCTLAECSEERIVRLIAKDVKGVIHLDTIQNKYGVGYLHSFDAYIDFYFCDIPSEFQVDGLDVKFDGKLLDACGYYQPVWPIEEIYILKIDKIQKL
ncbi:MAG: hypothetical protein IPP15_05030 [Saprospiraceae bacterium]|uniref:Uncharacterized protein n=1 Tax=Candidatus Opimibacter skivensis TaxID=2982028 RepID=A0A9D7XSJ5_9BACT|nr:hypothetical protein [Candidatus Opimibacter skivensis]